MKSTVEAVTKNSEWSVDIGDLDIDTVVGKIVYMSKLNEFVFIPDILEPLTYSQLSDIAIFCKDKTEQLKG